MAVIILTFEQRFYHTAVFPKDADGTANGQIDPYKSSLILSTLFAQTCLSKYLRSFR